MPRFNCQLFPKRLTVAFARAILFRAFGGECFQAAFGIFQQHRFICARRLCHMAHNPLHGITLTLAYHAARWLPVVKRQCQQPAEKQLVMLIAAVGFLRDFDCVALAVFQAV